MIVTGGQLIRDASGNFGCPHCWSAGGGVVRPPATTCPRCGVALEWSGEAIEAWDHFDRQRQHTRMELAREFGKGWDAAVTANASSQSLNTAAHMLIACADHLEALAIGYGAEQMRSIAGELLACRTSAATREQRQGPIPMTDDTGDSLTADDRHQLAAITHADDPQEIARLVRAYYGDADRADRTPRGLLYVHLGFLAGRLERLARIGPLRSRNGDHDNTP